MKKTVLSPGGLGVAAVLFLFLNILVGASLRSARLDLTEQKLYTLSEGSRSIARGLEEPVTLKLFVSQSQVGLIPALQTYSTRVRDLLDEFVVASQGGLVLQVIDPEPFSEEEDRAVEAGLQGVPASAAGELIYFGLTATTSTDDQATIPFFNPNNEASLEYDVSRMIYKLAHPDQTVVGVITSLPLQGGPSSPIPGAPPPSDPWFIMNQVAQFFDVRYLDETVTEIPEDVGVLLVVHPKNLGDDALYAIDQFVVGGGHALVFVDPHCEADEPPRDPSNPMASMMAPRSSDLGPLLEAWGLRLDSEFIVGDREAAVRVNAGSPAKPEVVDYVVWLSLEKDNHDAEDFVTQGLGSLMVPTAGVLTQAEGAETEFSPLIWSGPKSMRIPATSVKFMPSPKSLLQNFMDGDTELTIAARVSGIVHSAFPDGPPGVSAEDDAGEEASDDEDGGDDEGDEYDGSENDASGHRSVSEGPVHLVVVADVDMLADRSWVQFQSFFGTRLAVPRADNADFVINALDNLSGSNDLISLRSRAGSARPFERMLEIRRDAEQRYLAKEQGLQQKLRDTETRLTELQQKKEEGSSLILSKEQQAEIDRFQAQRLATRKELRAVKHELQKDIKGLQTWLKFVNIGLIPGLIGVLAVARASLKSRSRQAGTARRQEGGSA